jgi:type IV pilus assembly protein PilM
MTLLGGNNQHFGLDIGTNAVRLVQLSGGSGRYTLESFGIATLPAGLTQSDSKLDLQKLAKIIDDLLKSSGVDANNVVSAIPGTSVFTALVKMPPMSESELAKAIIYQAEQNIPLKLEDVKYDWQVIRQDPQTKETAVMIIAAAKGKVEQTIELFDYAGLNVEALETATVATARSLATPTDPLVMILDIGATTTEIAIVDNGVLSQTRSFPLAGIAMTRAIAQNLGLEPDQAEQFKQKFGLSQDKLEGQVFRVCEPILKNILEEAIRSSKFYEEQFGKAVNRVVLTGGTSRLPLLAEYIKNYMQVEVIFGNPWSKVSYQPSFSDKLNQIAPEFAVAVGLAMRE